MTIDEAIKHYEEMEKNLREQAETADLISILDVFDIDFYKRCAADHRQLAEWLKELRAYRKLRICGNCRHYVSGTTHFGECHVASDIEPCVVSIDQTACDTFFDFKDFRNGV